MRFDRRPGDIFELQDEIAVQVTQALELSVDPDAMERMKGQGTTNLKAYLDFLQGRTLVGTSRVIDAKDAIEMLEESIKLDPGFAAAYVSLAEAELFVAEFDVTDDRQERFERAKLRARELLEKALALDPENGDAYLKRAYLAWAFQDLAAAEADYRRGLELSPNSAAGFAGLALFLYQTPSRRDEALELLDRARKLDPLKPDYDVYKAVFLFYERGDVQGANDLLVEVLRDHPKFLPALARICELRSFAMARKADGVMYCEQALALDPLSAETRHILLRDYLDLGDTAAARQIASGAGTDALVPQILLQMHEHDWVRAGEGAYDALARGTATPTVEGPMVAAIKMHARVTGETRRARLAIEDVAGVSWDATGRPVWSGSPSDMGFVISLAEVMLLDGDRDRGQRLLAGALGRMNHEIRDLRRPEQWYGHSRSRALALLGNGDAALAMLEHECESDCGWVDGEPSYATLRQDPRFKKIVSAGQQHLAAERRELDRMRAEGLLPDRNASARPPD
jgi:Tfp pilus assembly protein PilF